LSSVSCGTLQRLARVTLLELHNKDAKGCDDYLKSESQASSRQRAPLPDKSLLAIAKAPHKGCGCSKMLIPVQAITI
jgi:hypothetical protein